MKEGSTEAGRCTRISSGWSKQAGALEILARQPDCFLGLFLPSLAFMSFFRFSQEYFQVVRPDCGCRHPLIPRVPTPWPRLNQKLEVQI